MNEKDQSIKKNNTCELTPLPDKKKFRVLNEFIK